MIALHEVLFERFMKVRLVPRTRPVLGFNACNIIPHGIN